MESVMTVRLNGDMKERAAAIMRREGYTPSSAVRRLFEYTRVSKPWKTRRHAESCG